MCWNSRLGLSEEHWALRALDDPSILRFSLCKKGMYSWFVLLDPRIRILHKAIQEAEDENARETHIREQEIAADEIGHLIRERQSDLAAMGLNTYGDDFTMRLERLLLQMGVDPNGVWNLFPRRNQYYDQEEAIREYGEGYYSDSS